MEVRLGGYRDSSGGARECRTIHRSVILEKKSLFRAADPPSTSPRSGDYSQAAVLAAFGGWSSNRGAISPANTEEHAEFSLGGIAPGGKIDTITFLIFSPIFI
ncbi:MAG TPA: hypothetical protein VH682_15650 [Gemmataceae bacterium]|jgi:hypothetical protein